MDARPIWTAGMEAINAAVQPEAVAKAQADIFDAWTAEVLREAMTRVAASRETKGE